MKLFLMALSMISLSALASIDKVRTFERNKDQIEVTLWGNNKVWRFNEKDARVPCFENAYKSQMRVDLDLDERGNLKGCRLSANEYPGSSPAR